MIEATFEELTKRRFQPTRHGTTDNGLPIYLLGNTNRNDVVMKNLTGNRYFVHLVITPNGKHLNDVDIESEKRYDNVKTLAELV